ncbi:efflux RND transporter periplasmic adaptor subunit [Desertivirga arenae]|uniref:efflux RND transporter periplasmic adaptor subunit n=1 Tax=Desertivirga arenae TaxID=2810309 RepID=UPI001A97BA5A|nr:efflux RND transporter periplasmic adaptor subunit [Pedobacter sp. SYSU D00823]
MKRFILIISLLFTVLSVLSLNSCQDYHEEEKTAASKHTCPMHPQIIKDEPGSCPICGMDLVPMTKGATKTQLVLSKSQIQLADVKTISVSTGSFTTSKSLNGRVVSNPEATEVISSRYAGRIEKLYIKETGLSVTKGQPLFQIYSEELQVIQQDYLLQIKQMKAFPEEKIYVHFRNAARNKLLLFGYSEAQIKDLERKATISPFVTVYAKASGVVQELSVTEGQYVSEGSSILKLENLSTLWVEADIYPEEAARLKEGTAVRVSIEGGAEQAAEISFIAPALEASAQLLKVRINIRNSGSFQPGMRAVVTMPTAHISDAIALPIDAVVRDENGATVWVKTGKETFEYKKVTTGQEDENKIIITSGLEGVKEVVVSGAYLLSSQLQLAP